MRRVRRRAETHCWRARSVRRRAEPGYFSDNTYCTSFLMSSSLTVTFGGMGTVPQTPEPPSLTFAISFASAPASPAYFLRASTSEVRKPEADGDRAGHT